MMSFFVVGLKSSIARSVYEANDRHNTKPKPDQQPHSPSGFVNALYNETELGQQGCRSDPHPQSDP